ncbi:hypothetical protein MycrhN_3468 [Mycolicibacterium rhodesiae NBB3]|jgi:hypothetical protein|uniref:Uncharacterized protein n=1 Tax=Mycolicibacterium rhodesiae (strain NBB3) TaxID=710685 RepID=G8RS31_MYCRN|nr:hypothetical protein MycrhN_3468 [Mycolicibacterium rhodesiae NBB3]
MSSDSAELAIVLAVVAVVGGLIAAEIGRRGTRYAADLQAQQAFREVQVSILTEFIETVLNTARAVQSYAFGASAEQRGRRDHGDEWADIQPLLGPALTAVQRARALSKSLIWQDITDAYNTCDDFFFKIIRGSEGDEEYQTWADVLYDETDPVTVVVAMAGDRRREVLDAYRA